MEQRENLGFVHIKRVEIENIRGLEQLDLDFVSPDGPRRKSVIIGRNGTGKSTLLRSWRSHSARSRTPSHCSPLTRGHLSAKAPILDVSGSKP